MERLTHKEARERQGEMRRYCREGHIAKEVAERFGTSESYAMKICRGIHPGNQYTGGLFDREANAIKIINERTPRFEYVGNFTGVDGYVDLKCKACGTVMRKSFVSVRHGKATCAVCMAEENRKKKAITEKKKKAKRESDKKIRQWQRALSKDYEQVDMRVCPVCHSIFIGNNIYCSSKCREQNKWHMKDGYRKLFPLEEVWERDNGICYLCGRPCDWTDKEEKDGIIIYGNMYPSRDHVKAKSTGGANSWENIRLAHRVCNSRKSNAPMVKN